MLASLLSSDPTLRDTRRSAPHVPSWGAIYSKCSSSWCLNGSVSVNPLDNKSGSRATNSTERTTDAHASIYYSQRAWKLVHEQGPDPPHHGGDALHSSQCHLLALAPQQASVPVHLPPRRGVATRPNIAAATHLSSEGYHTRQQQTCTRQRHSPPHHGPASWGYNNLRRIIINEHQLARMLRIKVKVHQKIPRKKLAGHGTAFQA